MCAVIENHPSNSRNITNQFFSESFMKHPNEIKTTYVLYNRFRNNGLKFNFFCNIYTCTMKCRL